MKGPSAEKARIVKKEVIFALRVGIFKSKTSTPDENYQSIEVTASEHWNYQKINSCVDFLDLYPSPPHPEKAPARAYSKMREAHELFNLDFMPNENVVEIGSAPGGISYYLLTCGLKVVAIDPAKMDPNLEINFPKTFSHIKKSIFDVIQSELPKGFEWLVSDLNLPGDLNALQCSRIINMSSKVKGGFITLKTPLPQDIDKIESWKQFFVKYFHVQMVNLPAHKKEIGFILKRRT